jgi:multidrug efflux pump subunit AcrA (membrane-fusion protein)
MIRTYLLPAIAVAGVAFAGWTVVRGSRPVPVAAPVAEPATAAAATFVAGAGIVEPSTEAIAIGTALPGIVTTVQAAVGAEVRAGDPLFQIDDRSQRALLAVQDAAARAAKAGMATADATLADVQQQLTRWDALADKRAISVDELEHYRNAARIAAARRAEAEAQSAQAAAQRAATAIEVERLTVRAPVDGTVLQVKVRPGESAPTGVLATPLVTLGATTTLHVRVDIDENDAWRVAKDAPAEAMVRGNSTLRTALKFVRFEPYVVPKRSLTGDSTERVDTRVLQVIYAFERKELAVYVGQQMDVFITAPAVPAAVTAPAARTAAPPAKQEAP